MSKKECNWKWTCDGSVDVSISVEDVAEKFWHLRDQGKIRTFAVCPVSASTVFINCNGRAQPPTEYSPIENGSWAIATIGELRAAQRKHGFIGPRSEQGKRTDRDLKHVDLDELADALLGDDGPPSTPSGESSTRGDDGPPPKVARPPSTPSGESSTASDFGFFDRNGNAVATEVAMGELEARLDEWDAGPETLDEATMQRLRELSERIQQKLQRKLQLPTPPVLRGGVPSELDGARLARIRDRIEALTSNELAYRERSAAQATLIAFYLRMASLGGDFPAEDLQRLREQVSPALQPFYPPGSPLSRCCSLCRRWTRAGHRPFRC